MRRFVIAIAAGCLASGLAYASAKDRRTPPPATPVGKPVDCIPIRSIQSTRVHGDNVIDFHMGGKTVYRNTLPHSCPQLGFEERFSYQTSLSQLCSTDIITVLVQAGGLDRGASCGLGQFQPVELDKKAKK